MNLFNYFREIVIAELEDMAAAGDLPRGLDTAKVAVEPPRETSHGDISTNAAMVLAKAAGRKPRDIAETLAARLRGHPDVDEANVAGPGFLNLRLKDPFWHRRLIEILKAGTAYGDSHRGANAMVNVEYVSANPTGPMHVGHGRGAVFGDVLASLLEKVGHRVTREYYVNDAGAQVDILAQSAFLRYREALGETMAEGAFEGFYPGDYLVPVGHALKAKYGEGLLAMSAEERLPLVRAFTIDAMMDLIREDLKALGVVHSVFFSERKLVESGGVVEVEKTLTDADLLYTGVLEPPKGKLPDDWEARPQTLFRATSFGDDVDRPLRKSDGSWTYFASDIAYHLDKFRRGFNTMIDVWGADHGGYIKRMQAAVAAVTGGRGVLDVKICQLVNLLNRGEPVRMSKRAGTFVTLREVIDEVGKDVVRFIMLTRKNDASLDFDLVKVTEQSRDNPVFYVQYAHARAHSVLRHAAEAFEGKDLSREVLAKADVSCLTDPAELGLIRMMAGWPRLVESAADAHEPHRVAFYLYDLAAAFHMLWNKGKDDASLRFIVAEDKRVTVARLALVRATSVVIASGLKVFGVVPVEEMR